MCLDRPAPSIERLSDTPAPEWGPCQRRATDFRSHVLVKHPPHTPVVPWVCPFGLARPRVVPGMMLRAQPSGISFGYIRPVAVHERSGHPFQSCSVEAVARAHRLRLAMRTAVTTDDEKLFFVGMRLRYTEGTNRADLRMRSRRPIEIPLEAAKWDLEPLAETFACWFISEGSRASLPTPGEASPSGNVKTTRVRRAQFCFATSREYTTIPQRTIRRSTPFS